MQNILELMLHPSGAITPYEDGANIGFQLEEGATTIRVRLPEELYGKKIFLEFLRPDGTAVSTGELTEVTPSSGSGFHYVDLVVGSLLNNMPGRVSMQVVARDAANASFIAKSKTIPLEVFPSINAGATVDASDPDFAQWVVRQLGGVLNAVREAQAAASAAQTQAEAAGTAASNAQGSATAAQESASSANTRATSAETKAEEAKTTAQGAVSTANAANTKAEEAKTSAAGAVSTANSANTVAGEAKTIAQGANTVAGEAKTIAQGASASASSAVSTANAANTAAGNAVTAANNAQTVAAGAVTTANAVKAEVEEFFHTKLGIIGPYTKLNDTKVGGTMTVNTKVKASSNYLIEYFHGKNIWNAAGMTIGGDANHPNDAYSALIPAFAEYLYLTIPEGWRVYIKEVNALAYKGTGTVIAEHHFEQSGLITLAPATIGKSIRIYACKFIDGEEVLPSAAELTALAAVAQLEYGVEATEHESYLAPVVVTPSTYAVNGQHIIQFDNHYGYLAFVPATGTSDDSMPEFASSISDYTKTNIIYETSELAQQVVENTIKNENQDAKLIEHENRIKALEQTSGNEVFGTQFTALSTVGVRLLSSAGKTVDFDQGVNDFQSVMPFLNIQEVEELSYDPSTGNEILDNGNHLVSHWIYFPDLYLQLVTMTNASAETVQTLYVSTVARSNYTKVGHFLYGKYAGAWKSSDASDYIGPFRGKEVVANYAWTSAAAKMIGIKDPALGLDSVTKVWSVPSGQAYTAISFLLVTLLGSRNAQAYFRGICDEGWNDRGTVAGWGNSGSSSNTLVVASSHAIGGLGVGDKFSVFTGGNRWTQRTILTKTVDSPSAGKTTFTFDGAALNYDSGTLFVEKVAGQATGATDSIVGDFGKISNNGFGAFKVFGIENFYANLWLPLAGVAIKQTYDVGTSTPHNEVIVDRAATIAQKTDYSGFTATGLEVPTSGGYALTMGMTDGFMITTQKGGNASTSAGWCDNFWTDARSSEGTSYRQVMVGAVFSVGSDGGPFYFSCNFGWGGASCNVGLRPFLPLP